MESLVVSFEIREGDNWIDPDGIAWTVAFVDGDTAHFSRKAVTEETAKTVARKWRKAGESDG